MFESQNPLYVLDFGNQQNRDRLRFAHGRLEMVVSLRNGFDMRRPAVDGIATLRPDGDLAISVDIDGTKQVTTWAYTEVLEALDYLEAI